MRVTVDLHNHSCLSPCASLEMSPRLMASLAHERGIRIMALTDHNSALNTPAFATACRAAGVAPLFGLELNSLEEVHLLCVFATPAEALAFGADLYPHLPLFAWDTSALGDQVAVDDDENIIDMPEKWLGAALDIGFDELAAEGARRGALVIPAHVDRPSNSVGSQLGFLPKGPYDAVESLYDPPRSLTRGLPALSGSDAHAPEQIGRRPFALDLDLDESALAAAGAPLLSALRADIARGPVVATRVPRRA